MGDWLYCSRFSMSTGSTSDWHDQPGLNELANTAVRFAHSTLLVLAHLQSLSAGNNIGLIHKRKLPND